MAAGARTGLAAEVKALRDNLLQVANTKFNGRPVFGGTTSGGAAYDATGTFVGDTNAVVRTVGDGVSVQVDANGPQVFGTGCDATSSRSWTTSPRDITANPGNLGGHLDRLQAATAKVTDALADLGSRSSRVDRMRQSADDRVLTLSSNLSQVQDIDLPKTIMAAADAGVGVPGGARARPSGSSSPRSSTSCGEPVAAMPSPRDTSPREGRIGTIPA